MISTHHLRVFDAIARERSLGGAALLLGCTQATVSHHLASFEKELGTALFIRGRRGAELTDRGRVLLDHAELILSELVAAERAVEDLVNLREGKVRITSFATAGATFLPQILAAFRKEHPGVELSVTECEVPSIAVEDVRSRREDVGIVYTTPGHWIRPVAGLAVIKLFEDPLEVLLSPRHPLAKNDSVHLGELAGESWISARSAQDPCRLLLNEAAKQAGFEPHVMMHVDDYAMIGGCVMSGIAVALVPRLALSRLPEGVRLLPISGAPIVREVSALALGDGGSLPATRLVALLKSCSTYMGNPSLGADRRPA